MTQRHGDRLSSTDAAFLAMETPTQHMHVGGLFVFDPPPDAPFDHQRFVALVRSRLHLVPRYRQRLAFPPLDLSTPVWVDDPDFDLGYHLRHAALPAPGTTAQLTEYCARILSRQLDRDRPLWELYVVEGLRDGRVALLGKTHHAMVDGVSGLDLAALMLDLDPTGEAEIPPPQPWEPADPPAGIDLALAAVGRAASSPQEAWLAVQRLADAPTQALRAAAGVGRAVASIARQNLIRPAPPSLLNRRPGRHRRFEILRISLDDVKGVKDAFSTTVNDVVLALVGDAVGRYLRHRGADTDGVVLRAMVPVSVRARGDEAELGNQVVSVFAGLPVGEVDPVVRLQAVAAEMATVKTSHHAVGARAIIGLGDFAPAGLHAAAARLASRTRLYNLLVTNVPGPQFTIHTLGARLLGAFPFAPLAGTQSLAVGVTSVDGWFDVGLTADYDAVPDVEVLPGMLRGALADLMASAEAVGARHELARRSPPTATGPTPSASGGSPSPAASGGSPTPDPDLGTPDAAS